MLFKFPQENPEKLKNTQEHLEQNFIICRYSLFLSFIFYLFIIYLFIYFFAYDWFGLMIECHAYAMLLIKFSYIHMFLKMIIFQKY